MVLSHSHSVHCPYTPSDPVLEFRARTWLVGTHKWQTTQPCKLKEDSTAAQNKLSTKAMRLPLVVHQAILTVATVVLAIQVRERYSAFVRLPKCDQGAIPIGAACHRHLLGELYLLTLPMSVVRRTDLTSSLCCCNNGGSNNSNGHTNLPNRNAVPMTPTPDPRHTNNNRTTPSPHSVPPTLRNQPQSEVRPESSISNVSFASQVPMTPTNFGNTSGGNHRFSLCGRTAPQVRQVKHPLGLLSLFPPR